MKITVGGAALAIALALSGFDGTGAAANPNARLVLITNNSPVCVRFDAVGVRDIMDNGPRHRSASTNMEQAGTYEKIDAAPDHTVRFEKLSADRAHVWASPRVGDCHSTVTGTFVGPYFSQGPREHITWEQTPIVTFGFKHVAFGSWSASTAKR